MSNSNRRVLIIDDVLENLQVIYQILDKAAISDEISLATSVQQAYQVIKNQLPALIITDWEMPDVDGIELINSLKENPLTQDIPVIICTGVMTSPKNLETALEAGAIDYLRKPIDSIELIARVKANLHLAEQYQEIKQLNESKETLFSIISHDLRGAIGRINALTDIFKMSDGNLTLEEMKHFMEIIGKQSGSISNILENLLLWARDQNKPISINLQTQIIHKAIQENINLLEGLASNKKIKITNLIPNHLEATYDLNMTSTIFRNLIANAIKFTPENGQITLDVKETPNTITFSVEDNGVGIAPERIDKIFDKNNFETTSGTEKERGSGLGLKLCKDFIEKQSGKIWVESEEGKGSIFKFTLNKK